jgi:hypothetical protein
VTANGTKAPGGLKGEVYRQARLWHGWLSALAFGALIFFALTGLFLNHPGWFKSQTVGPPAVTTVVLPPAELAAAAQAADPGRALADAVGRRASLRGGFQSSEVVDGEAMIRLEGVRGASDLTVDLKSGRAEVSVERATLVSTLNELHRGKNAGAAWKLVIDAVAILTLVLSLLGYVLFFTLRFRLRTGLVLTAVSLAAMAGVFILLTP